MDCRREDLNLLSIVREAMEALARCDCDCLEQMVCHFESRIDDRRDRRGPAWEGSGFAEAEAFARLLEITKENLRIVGQLRPASFAPLEYVPIAGPAGRRAVG